MTFLEKIKTAQSLIAHTFSSYDRVVVASSFGKDSMVVCHLAQQIKTDFQIITVFTPFKPAMTINYAWQMIDLYNLKVLHKMKLPGPTDFCQTDPDQCCQLYKVEPLKELLAETKAQAWITGLRRSEGQTRTNFQYQEEKAGLVKINPILYFNELDVWRYLALYQIPVNPLYKEGYRSLGCWPCSQKEEDEQEGERAGRWAHCRAKQGGECGIHSQSMKL